jgi:hypothetical protein
MIKRYIVLFALCSLLYPVCFLPSNACASAEWEVTLRVEAGGGYNKLVLGADTTATEGYDSLWEVYAMLGGKIEAYFPHSEWGFVQQAFSRDIRAKAAGTTTEWLFEVNSPDDDSGNPSLSNYEFTIKWDLSRIPEDYTIFLIDNTTAQQTDMRLNPSYSFFYTDSRTFRVAVYVPPDVALPDPPRGLTGELSNDVVVLSWKRNRELDLAGYNVYRSKTAGSGYRRINHSLVSRHKFTDRRIVKGRTYYYVVTAVNTSGGESGYSHEVSVTYERR